MKAVVGSLPLLGASPPPPDRRRRLRQLRTGFRSDPVIVVGPRRIGRCWRRRRQERPFVWRPGRRRCPWTRCGLSSVASSGRRGPHREADRPARGSLRGAELVCKASGGREENRRDEGVENGEETEGKDQAPYPVVPWGIWKTVQVMFLWLVAFFAFRASIWNVGMWVLGVTSEADISPSGLAAFTLGLDISMLGATFFILRQSLREYTPLRAKGLFPFRLRGRWWIHVLISCISIPLVDWLGTRIMVWFPNDANGFPNSTEVQLAKGQTLPNILYFILLSICAPLWEETMFRGFLIPSLGRYLSTRMAILASSGVFAIVHGSLRQFIPLFILGIVIGNAFVSSQNLLPSIMLHSLYNSYVFVHVLLGM